MVLSNAPLFYSLIQVIFNPLPTLAKDQEMIAAIQDKFRRAGFPDLLKEQSGVLQIADQPMQLPPGFEPQPRWHFMNSSRTEGFTLIMNAIAFHTTRYTDEQTFVDRTLMGVQIIHEVASLAYVDRIGVRLLNAIKPGEGCELDQYVLPAALGLIGAKKSIDGRNFNLSVNENRIDLSDGPLHNRVIVATLVDSKPLMPGELLPMHLTLQPRFENLSGTMAFVDSDHWTEGRVDFNSSDIDTTFDVLRSKSTRLKANLRSVFQLLVTPHALKEWE